MTALTKLVEHHEEQVKKVAILAFDGLEYDLVERFRLKKIKQRKYGKMFIPKGCYAKTGAGKYGEGIYEPYTPYVWSAFLTGKVLDKEKLVEWDNPIIQFLRILSLKIGLGRVKGKGRVFEKVGFERRNFSLENFECPTIFSYAKKPCIINVPTISKEWRISLEGKNFNEMLDASWHYFYEFKNKTLKAIRERNWDLLMAYTKLLDTVGELCFGDFREIFKAYGVCNHFVGEIKKNITSSDVCLIVSDHGMERFGKTSFGKHSDHAFYSLNIKTSWKPETILDLFCQIVNWLVK